MGIVKTSNTLDKTIKNFVQKVESRILNALHYMGEQCLAEARSNYEYVDRTGNLTASMGYAVTKDGIPITIEGFVNNASGGGQKGRELINKLASEVGGTYALIVVAGMNYAYYVESRGYNVLTSSEQLAEKQLPILLRRLKIR